VDLVREVSTPGPEGGNHWIDLALRIPQWGWLQDWAAYPDSNYIPHAFSLEFEHCHHPLLTEREWTVGCAPENHHGSIQYFVENVLPVIAEQIDWCYTLDRRNPLPTEWNLADGKMVCNQRPLIAHPDSGFHF
jgi:hypothetical protein